MTKNIESVSHKSAFKIEFQLATYNMYVMLSVCFDFNKSWNTRPGIDIYKHIIQFITYSMFFVHSLLLQTN